MSKHPSSSRDTPATSGILVSKQFSLVVVSDVTGTSQGERFAGGANFDAHLCGRTSENFVCIEIGTSAEVCKQLRSVLLHLLLLNR